MEKRIVFTGKGQVALEQFPKKPIGSGDAGIRTLFTMISTGTETIVLNRLFEKGTHWDNWVKYPFYPGYAAIGVVEETGADVAQVKKDDIVAFRCGHASYHVVPSGDCIVVPAGIDLKDAAWFALAKIASMAARIAQPYLGAGMLIIGAGPVGQMMVRWACAGGAESVIVVDMIEERLRIAVNGGATAVISKPLDTAINEIREANNGGLPSIVIDSTGNAAVLAGALKVAAPRGKVILLGDTGNPEKQHLTTDVMKKGLYITAAHDNHEDEEWNTATVSRKFFKLVTAKRFVLDGLITHTFAPEQCCDAYDIANTRRGDTMGMVFEWKDRAS